MSEKQAKQIKKDLETHFKNHELWYDECDVEIEECINGEYKITII